MKFRPLGKRVLVERIKSEEKVGRFYIPDSAKERPAEGVIIAIGSGTLVANGDRILFGKYSGSEIKLEGVLQLILTEDEILGVLESN